MRFRFAIIISFLLLDTLLFAVWLAGNKMKIGDGVKGAQNYPEAQEISGKNLSFAKLESFFANLAKKKGTVYSFEVLKIVSLPPNTDTHLLGHVIGEILYREQGANGIQYCTEDFRNACSHSIVVGLFSDKGEKALTEIKEACKLAPGGKGAYLMCYHGLGHGILAYKQYDLEEAIKLCQKTGTKKHNNQEYPECVSGEVMEIISGGGHDRDKWAKQRTEYLKNDDPLYVCSSDFMPEATRGRCYDYITPYLWEAVGSDLGNPSEEDFKKSFKLCDQVVEENYRNICYGGFGKEFVGLVASRDIRSVDQMSNAQLSTIYNWCKLSNDKNGISVCMEHALSSLYWGGENDRNASIRFCSVVSDLENQRKCFLSLIDKVAFYIQDPKYKESFCKEIPNEFTNECKKRLVQKN